MSFTKSHFDNDSLTAFIKEKIKLKEAEKLKHGYLYYLNGLYSLAEGEVNYINENEKKEISKLYRDLVKSGPSLYAFFTEHEYRKSKSEHFDEEYWKENDMPLKPFSAAQLSSKFKSLSNMIIGSYNINSRKPIDISDSTKFELKISNSANNDKSVYFPETLIDIIFAELIINAKKNFPEEKVRSELYFEIKNIEKDWFEIMISNNYSVKSELKPKDILRFDKNNVKYNTNGLGLIKRISGLLCDNYAVIKQGYSSELNKKVFQVSVIIKNLQNE